MSTGPPTEHLRAVPFTRSLQGARSDYDDYHSSLISYIPSLSPAVKERFLPFWGVYSLANVSIRSAEIGYSKYSYNIVSKRMEHRIFWKSVYFTNANSPSWDRRHDPGEDLDMQIYASYEYRRAYVNGLRCFDCFRGATRLRPEMVESEHGVRGLEEFRMSAQAALDLSKKAVNNQALADARKILLRMYPGASHTSNILLDVKFTKVMVAPVYVPVFIFESAYLTEVVRTFVHGARSGAVGGQRLYHVPLAAIAGGFAGAGYMYFKTGSFPMGATVLVAAIASTMALLSPVLLLRFREWMRVREDNREVWRDWGQEYVSAYEMWEEFARKEEARRERERARRNADEEARRSGSWWQRSAEEEARRKYSEQQAGYQKERQERTSYPSGDPKGYYASLGLKPGASESEIKAAFRAMALKHHPDRHQDPKNKEKAKANFVKISEAYEVLRDPRKRSAYGRQSWT